MTDAAEIKEIGTCWFCEKAKAEATAAYVVHFWRDIRQLRDRVDYSRLAIAVPRCGKCKARHRLAKIIKHVAITLICIGVVTSGIFLNTLPMNHSMHGLAAWCFIVMLILFIVGIPTIGLIIDTAMKNNGIRSVDDGAFPEVRDRLIDGWSLGEDPPSNLLEQFHAKRPDG
jgi:hypothetical protein